jgi:hemoglobin
MTLIPGLPGIRDCRSPRVLDSHHGRSHPEHPQEPPSTSQPQPQTPVGGAPPSRQPSTRQPDLWERIGGREVIERVVTEFYTRVEQDPELRALFPEDMTEGRRKQAEFLEQWLGGEPLYSAKYGHPRLRMRHFPFVIDQRAAGRWLRHMGEALRAAGVGEPEIAEILNGLGPLARHMINADQDVPRQPLGDVFLQ